MKTEPQNAFDWAVDDDIQFDAAHLLWEATTDDGDWVGLLTIPELGYVIARRSESLYDRGVISVEDLGSDYITLGRAAAGQLALALITALINNSDQIIDSYIQEIVTRRQPSATA